jgi:hypothetical protein
MNKLQQASPTFFISAAIIVLSPLVLTGTFILPRGILILETEAIKLERRQIVEAQLYHSWPDIHVPAETDELVHCYGETTSFRLPKYEVMCGI